MKGNLYPGEAEKISFGDGLPGYVCGEKGAPAVIVIQARGLPSWQRCPDALPCTARSHRCLTLPPIPHPLCRSGGACCPPSSTTRCASASRATGGLGATGGLDVGARCRRLVEVSRRRETDLPPPSLPPCRSCLIPDLYKGKVGVDKEEASHLYSNLNFVAAVDELKQVLWA